MYQSQLPSRGKKILLGLALFLGLVLILGSGVIVSNISKSDSVENSSTKQWLEYFTLGDFEKCDSMLGKESTGLLDQEFKSDTNKGTYEDIIKVVASKCVVTSIETLDDSDGSVKYAISIQVPDYDGLEIDKSGVEESIKELSQKFVTGEIAESDFKTQLQALLKQNLLNLLDTSVPTKEVLATLTDKSTSTGITVEGTKGFSSSVLSTSKIEELVDSYGSLVDNLATKYK